MTLGAVFRAPDGKSVSDTGEGGIGQAGERRAFLLENLIENNHDRPP